MPLIVKLFFNADEPDHVPFDIVIATVPVNVAFIVILPTVIVSAAVGLNVVLAVIINIPVTVKLPDNVFVAAPVKFILFGHVFPLLVIVDVLLIVSVDAPAIVYAVFNVTLPATVRTALWVIVFVYPDVIVKERIVIVADMTELVPLLLLSKVTSWVLSGTV